MKKKLFVVLAVFLTCAIAYPANGIWLITRLTNNNYWDGEVHVSGSNVVWQEQINDSGEIFFYNADTKITTQITNDNKKDEQPKVSGSNIAWAGGYASGSEIYLYDATTHSTIRLTNNGYHDGYPEISGTNIVWQGIPYNRQLYFYNGATQTITQLTNHSDRGGELPRQISGSYVTWAYGGKIFLYDSVSQTTTKLSDDSLNAGNPAVSTPYAAWIADGEVFLHDINSQTTAKLTNDGIRKERLQMSASNIVWQAHDGNDYEILFYNGSTQTVTQLTDNNYNDENPQISGSNIVWEGRSDDSEIFLYDADTQKTTQLTDNDCYDSNPKISGSIVVWVSDKEIFMATKPTELPPPTVIEIIGPDRIIKNSSAQFETTAYFDPNFYAKVTSHTAWSILPDTYATIDSNGLLTTLDIKEPQQITLDAQYTAGGVTVEAQKTVHIIPHKLVYGHYDVIDLSEGHWSCAYYINDKGQIVGVADIGNNGLRACLFDNTGGGANIYFSRGYCRATSINNNGQIVGLCGFDLEREYPMMQNRAYLFDPTGDGNDIDLGAFPGHWESQA